MAYTFTKKNFKPNTKMKPTLITIFALCVFPIQFARAEFDAQKLSYYRPLMSDMSGSSQRRHLHSIDAYRPLGSIVDIDSKITGQEFLKILEDKIKNTVTFDGSKLRSVIFKNAEVIGEIDVKLKTASVVEAVEYYCSISDNIWQIEQREDGVTLIIRNQNDNANPKDSW